MFLYVFFFFVKQKTAYEMRISDWSSDVALPISCRSDAIRSGRSASIARNVLIILPTVMCRWIAPIPRCSSAEANPSIWTARRSLTPATFSASSPSQAKNRREALDRKSVGEGKRVAVRVDLGGRRIIKKKKKKK